MYTITKYPKQIKADGMGESIMNRSVVRGSIKQQKQRFGE
jgi:hypothetical protein